MFFASSAADRSIRLYTSSEVLQELLHAYLPVQRLQTLRNAFELAVGATHEVWPIELDDVQLARAIGETRVGIGARDALHLACCQRRGARSIKTFDRVLEVAFGS